jgi:hypothetical protein
MKHYLQLNQDNIITDAVSYPVDKYVEYETEYPLIAGINGGWWKLVCGMLVEIVEKNPTTIANQVQSAIDAYTLELVDGGIL